MIKSDPGTQPLVSYWKAWIISFLIPILLLSGCHLPSVNQAPNQEYSEDSLSSPKMDVQFNLLLPRPVEKGEEIGLEILDEVSGLPHNKQIHTLKKDDDLNYSTSLSVQGGSVIKYRYTLIGETSTLESSFGAEPVRYRLFYVDGSNLVKDVLQAWGDEPLSSGTGTIKGVVLDEDTNQPIPDILISSGGQLVFTDANGNFLIGGIAEGQQNILFYSVDGKYRPYQQGAVISTGNLTPVKLLLKPAKPVNIRFRVSPPNDALGAPIYLAGNLIHLGNTFSDLGGGMSVKPKLMPQLIAGEDGTYTIDIQLYAGVDFRYKFTLGDGYWNAEQDSSGGLRTRQLIVPDQDVTIDQEIVSWRTPNTKPITFKVFIPPETSPKDEKFIQLKQDDWTEPLPLWPLGKGEYLYILFSPLSASEALSYRFCRNGDSQWALNEQDPDIQGEVIPGKSEQIISITINKWSLYQTLPPTTGTNNIPLPTTMGSYSRIIELSPEMDPSWQVYAPDSFATLSASGTDTVIFSPLWRVTKDTPYIQQELGQTPFHTHLSNLLIKAENSGLHQGIYPQIEATISMRNWWSSDNRTNAWWSTFFDSYSEMIFAYAKLAQQINAEMLLLGGKAVLPAFQGGVFPNGTESNVPENIDEKWRDLIFEIKETFTGDLIWVTNLNLEMDPLPDFIDLFDAIYISIDSPLTEPSNATDEAIAAGFTGIVDNYLYEVYRSTGKPIILALAYPSVNNTFQGCRLVNENGYNDGLFTPEELEDHPIDLQAQVLIYQSILPVIASRSWITGTAIRGFEPSVILHDASSSIHGKPASRIIFDWFLDIDND